MDSGKVLLLIMDGWGIAENPEVSAIDKAHTPFYDEAIRKYPFTQIRASEEWVGLPSGQMGNSEVGHMNIGAGRVVYQELVRISRLMESGEFRKNVEYQRILKYCKENDKPLHLAGLLSDGGVHSHIFHLKKLIQFFRGDGLENIFIHAFTDGRDTDPHSGIGFIRDLEDHINSTGGGQIATVIGRYYAMDRDKRWARIRKAFDLMVYGKGEEFSSAEEAVLASYEDDVSDEFITPKVITRNGEPLARIQDGDAVFLFNFRTDRARQLTRVLTQKDLREYNMHTLDLHYLTMTRYDEDFKGIHVALEPQSINMGLGEYLAKMGKKQIRIAETEKYPHVTFFFNGGREEPLPGESHLLCPSPRVATYDLQPEMSASDITEKILPHIRNSDADFICLNFANPDMVGHTGDFEAAVKAVEEVDRMTKTVVESAVDNGYSVLVTADHGNADKMLNEDGSPNTAHTTALVPLYLAEKENRFRLKKEGKLGDLAPTILTLMGLEIPEQMTGEVLIES